MQNGNQNCHIKLYCGTVLTEIWLTIYTCTWRPYHDLLIPLVSALEILPSESLYFIYTEALLTFRLLPDGW